MFDFTLNKQVREEIEIGGGVIISTFDARCNRVGYIATCKGICDVCQRDAKVIEIDGSEMEYGPGCICLTCATKALTS